MPFRAVRRLLSLAVPLTLAACVDFTALNSGLDIGGGHLVSISVAQSSVVEVGDTIRLTATGNLDGLLGMLSYDPILDARWSVSDPTVARLEPLPPPPKEDSFPKARTLIRGMQPGTVHVTATARGLSGEAIVRVFPAVSTIQLLSARDTVAVGDTILVTAAALDASGVQIPDVPLRFEFGAGLQPIAADSVRARVVAIAPGRTTVGAHFRRTTAEISLIVVPSAP
jgi:hypothetical protein